MFYGLTRTFLIGVNSAASDGQDAAVGRVLSATVFGFGKPEIGDAEPIKNVPLSDSGFRFLFRDEESLFHVLDG